MVEWFGYFLISWMHACMQVCMYVCMYVCPVRTKRNETKDTNDVAGACLLRSFVRREKGSKKERKEGRKKGRKVMMEWEREGLD